MSLFNDSLLHDLTVEVDKLKQKVKELENKIDKYNTGNREDDGILCESEQQESAERINCWFT